jgi:protein-S-isoprenylcysteine O-methyltransferase Ste14
MNSLRIAVAAVWVVFWIYWGISAVLSKRGTTSTQGLPLRVVLIVAVILVVRLLHPGSLDVHGTVLPVVGTLIVVAGLGFAVWARVHLGRNWGMPMSQKEEPELVTSGPYRLVRHPIYTGLLTAVVGTALVVNLLLLAVAAVIAVFFFYSATVEEQNLGAIFPIAYPAYRARTKMLIPFVI